MKTYSVDLRERLLRAIDAGLGVGEAAQLFGVGPATIRRWRQRQRATGSVAPRPKPGRSPKIPRTDDAALTAQVVAAPDATLAEHCAQWHEGHGVEVSAATMCRRLQRLGLPLKKSPSLPPSGMRRPGPPGGPSTPRSIRPPSSSSTRRAPTRR